MVTEAPATRAQSLAATIERHIVDARLAPGDPVGTIDEWRARSGFARATVSEALRLLVDRGQIEIRPGRGGGVFVARTGPVVRLRHTLLSVHGEATTLADAIAIRETLEPLLIMDATRARTAAHVRALRKGVAAIEAAIDDHDAFIREIWHLHELIAAITPNAMLRAMYLAMLQLIDEHAERATATDQGDDSSAYRAHRLAVHRELVDAIESRDPERASRAIAAHSAEAATDPDDAPEASVDTTDDGARS